MRYLLVVVLVMALVLPAAAAKPTYALVYNLTFSGGTITGTIGGVPVSGTYGGGTWTLTIDGKTFASGTYTCNGTCTFTGTTIAGKSLSFSFTTPATSSAPSGTASGQLTDAFGNHGGWVSAVATWASANLTGVRRGQIISAAAHNMQLLMQANGTTGSANSQAAANSHGNNAGGNGKGQGPK